jgi:hypothetical protein
MFWWSGVFWKYFQRVTERIFPKSEQVSETGENIVTRRTYMISNDPPDIPTSQWVYSNIPVFKKIYMPKPTIEGINRLLADSSLRNNPSLRVLNMTELTPLAVELPYKLERGPDVPLWYHLGVSMFNKDAAKFEQRIKDKYYDVVLFEYIPTLNNFYPFRVRDSLISHYQKVDSFLAPRREGDTDGIIEIYKK